jgi:hypothetical protein
MTDALPSLEVDVTVLTPEMPEIAFSMGSVSRSSTFSADAFGRELLTETTPMVTGGSRSTWR